MYHPFYPTLRPAFHPARLFRNEIEGVLASLLEPKKEVSALARSQSCAIFPVINVSEENDEFRLDAELPGVVLEALEVSVTGDELKISGERQSTSRENYRVHRREISTGKFSRTLKFPCELNADAVEASVRNGVLTLRLPKAVSAKPKKIQVTIQ